VNRRGLFVAAGAAAMAAGAGVAWWRYQPRGGESPGELWSMAFQTPQGTQLAMQSLRGKPLLLNFWATWCPPCVEEMPLLDAFYKAHSAHGWQVLGLAIDQPSAVRNFLQKTPVSYPIGLAGLEGTELGKSLGNLAGGLPFTVILGADGTVRHRRMGRVDESDLKQWAGLA
jgi:thiol-disulfide isomerase/thioredoxin